jgi:hypothetical protein
VLVSDSPSILVGLRRRLGLPVTVDRTVVGSLRWRNVMAAQLMGTRTLVEQVEYVAVGRRVEVDLRAPGPRARVVVRDLREVFAWDGGDYGATVRRAAVRIASLVHTIAGLGPEAARLSLSGGGDSRICLAAALLSPVARESARFTCVDTLPQHARDAEVVRALSAEFGFPLGPRQPDESRQAQLWRHPDATGLWFLDNALAYYPVRIQAFGLRARGRFAITGVGSELYKGNYGLRTIARIVDSIAASAPEVAADVDEVCTGWLAHSGVQRDTPLSAEWHYLCMRNAIHGGRSVPASKLGIRPIQQRTLVGLSKLPQLQRPPGMTGPGSISEDLLAALGPALSARPFDRPEKDHDASWVRERLAVLGGPVVPAEVAPYRVLGDPALVADGPVAALGRLLPPVGEEGPLTRERVQRVLAEASAIVAASDLGGVLRSVLDEADEVLADRSLPVGHARGSVGRVLSVAQALR